MLEEAVESVLSQTLLPGEILVVDDGSEDDTRERMEKRSGILYFRQVPSGQVVARNLGLSKNGEYVAFLDRRSHKPSSSKRRFWPWRASP